MATRRVAKGGRWRLPLILVAFLAISGIIILRRSLGIRTAREITELDARRSALVAERLRLEAEIRAASSRARLQPIAEQRLQMHVPADSQVILVPRTHETP
ncbi:MAG: cell division protein FtsL [Gemmatimonadota bacterium]